ncbi:hypothetical protein A3D14_00955 [Candidatus Saccharibacteria bacterium RIFCSPHIGHO2_02_FULL_47_12]|nr:MAG: hypothetical protein A3D14_00955 [Candidatus Saccharibacteria bacterium RIFCSPHIGHO2_02_FULL_47_12]
MVPDEQARQQELTLPLTVITKTDISRLARELESLDEFLLQASATGPKSHMSLPKTSHSLEDLSAGAGLKLTDKSDRQNLKEKLEQLRDTAPVMHFSFAAEPQPQFLQKILEWLRKEIHPNVLLQVGLMPDIAAGCVVRTTNRYFDFSLRHNLKDKRSVLFEGIRGKD